jgi:hypothetical protein
MKLSIGIVGLPNVGKSTLFKILTQNEVHIANYPFATIDPNVGVVSVPDERLEKLATMSQSKKVIPAVVEFYDIAGLVKGANKGEGLGNQFLSHIRETQAVVVVLRVFENPEIIHVEETVNPIRDLEIINTELILKDLDVVEKRLNSLEAEARRGDKKAQKNLEVIKQVQDSLVRNNLITQFASEEIVAELQLLTSKKQIYLLNGGKEDVKPDLEKKIKDIGADYIVANLVEDQNISELIKKSYEILNLISFFTTGEDETRAWTIRRGALAPEAAGTIHTDFEKKFIRAEVVGTDKLLETGEWVKAKQKGLIRLEGKEYEVKDGDVLVIRHG